MKRAATAVVALIALASLAAAWRWTPLAAWLDVAALLRGAHLLESGPLLTPLLVILAYVAAGLVVFPVMLLIVATGLAFGPVAGSLYAIAGAAASALVTFSLGRALGKRTVRRIAGTALHRLSRKLASRGVIAIAAVRLVPIAPFSVVNMVAGATSIKLGDFMLGTLCAMVPGIVVTVLLLDRIGAAIRSPTPGQWLLLTASVLGGIAVLTWLRSRLLPPVAHDDESISA